MPPPDRAPRSAFVAPPPGAEVHGDDLGAVEGPDASDAEDAGSEGERET